MENQNSSQLVLFPLKSDSSKHGISWTCFVVNMTLEDLNTAIECLHNGGNVKLPNVEGGMVWLPAETAKNYILETKPRAK